MKAWTEFKQTPTSFGFYRCGYRPDAPRYIYREKQGKFECYYDGVIIGSVKVKTGYLAEYILRLLMQDNAPGPQRTAPYRGYVRKPAKKL